MIGVFCHFPVFRRIGVTCAKSNHDRHRTHLGPIFLVLLKRSFDGVLGAPLRTTVLKIGVPRGINLPWKDHPPAGRGPGSSENMAPRTIWRESDGSHILPNHAQSRLEPIVIRFSTSGAYPTKTRKTRKTPIPKVGHLSFSTPEIDTYLS